MGNGQSPRQDRSRRRRDALLRATIELLGEIGAKSVTHRAVAERAGLPLASTTYYFESVNQLIEEALKLHVSERVAELSGMAAVALGAVGASALDIAERLAEVLAAGVLATLGAREPELTAEAFVALLDGFALHRLARPGSRPGRPPPWCPPC